MTTESPGISELVKRTDQNNHSHLILHCSVEPEIPVTPILILQQSTVSRCKKQSLWGMSWPVWETGEQRRGFLLGRDAAENEKLDWTSSSPRCKSSRIMQSGVLVSWVIFSPECAITRNVRKYKKRIIGKSCLLAAFAIYIISPTFWCELFIIQRNTGSQAGLRNTSRLRSEGRWNQVELKIDEGWGGEVRQRVEAWRWGCRLLEEAGVGLRDETRRR